MDFFRFGDSSLALILEKEGIICGKAGSKVRSVIKTSWHWLQEGVPKLASQLEIFEAISNKRLLRTTDTLFLNFMSRGQNLRSP